MSEQQAIPTAADLNAMVVAKAQGDAAFRTSVIDNPKAAVEKLFNQEIPAHVSFKVVQEAADQYTIVLPYQGAVGAGGELSDSDLEAVAGGSKSGAKNFFEKAGSGVGLGVAILATQDDLAGQMHKKCF